MPPDLAGKVPGALQSDGIEPKEAQQRFEGLLDSSSSSSTSASSSSGRRRSA